MAAIVVGALYSGYLYFATVRALVARTHSPFAESVAQAGSEPVRAPAPELAQVVEQRERVNVLLLGIDQRGDEPGPWRTDTIILVSIDPTSNSAAMLSVPRDLWVTIPAFGESRINMAHLLGDQHDYPGGGVALAKKTVWYSLGVPVDYYVRVNFTGFERLIDAIGGLTINVEKAIYDKEFPDNSYGTMTIEIPAGIQQMDGATALQYARSRHGTGDFDRMTRQQAVLLAARDKVMSLDIPLSRIPQLLELAGDSVKTDMSIEDLIKLAEIAKRIDRSRIRYGVIDGSLTTTVVTPENWMVEVPDWDRVRQLVNDLFPSPVPSAAPTPSVSAGLLASERARVVLENGTLVPGLAQRTAELLKAQGFSAVRYENADRFDHAETLLVSHADKPYTTQVLAAQLGVSPENIRSAAEPDASVDIVIILGRDYAQRESQRQ